MMPLLLKIICLVVVGMWLALEVEAFRLDYITNDRKSLMWDGAIILWLVTNVVILLMWT